MNEKKNVFKGDFLTEWMNYPKYYSIMQEMASLSKLFNDYEIPYVDYHFTESCFAKWFNAQNVSVGSTPFDAIIGNLGIGLKTFNYKHTKTLEKVSEFNKIASELKGLKDIDIIYKISELKNQRLLEGMKKYGVLQTIYFCIARRCKEDEEKSGIKELLFFPYDYSLIDISNIIITESTDKRILFNDSKNEYDYVFSKSTLYQRIIAPENAKIIQFELYPNPWNRLDKPEHDEFLEWYNKNFPEQENNKFIAEATYHWMLERLSFNIN